MGGFRNFDARATPMPLDRPCRPASTAPTSSDLFRRLSDHREYLLNLEFALS